MADEKEIGKVLHYFGRASAALIKLTGGDLKVGDTIHIKGHSTDLTQVVESMQVDRNPATEAKEGNEVGIKVNDHVRENDVIYLIIG